MSFAVDRLVQDIRALGSSGLARAAYEASKRSGFHAVVFSTRRRPQDLRSATVVLGNVEPTAAWVREHTLDDAKAVLAEGVRIFGQRLPIGVSEPWNRDPLIGRQWPVSPPWWRIDIRSANRLGDVKYVWEAARHRDLVVLARASRLDPSGPWPDALNRMVLTWCRQNRPERGVNWYSSLELALRTIAWSQVIALAGDQLAAPARSGMDEQMQATARHLMLELPYTLSSMKNNHLLGDALGLLVLARMFPQSRSARWWSYVGERLFEKQLARHMRPDGSMIEDSLSYHRFVLEMLIVRTLLGGESDRVRVALRGASLHLAALGVFDGEVPQYGDWDEGRVLASSGNPSNVAGSAALGMALAGEPIRDEWRERYDELAWYAPESSTVPSPDRPARSVSTSGGIAHVHHGLWDVWFKVGSGPSHGHADLTSVWVKHDGRWLIADPGTGTYNGAIEVRNGLRTSAAHPVLRIGGADQLGPHRAFRWLRTARGHLAPLVQIDDRTILFGWHDAYTHLAAGLRVARTVILTDSYLVIVDQVSPEGAGRHTEMTLPLAPGITWDGRHLTGERDGVPTFGLSGAVEAIGQQTPFRGWFSRTYGQREASTWLSINRQERTTIWGLGAPPELAVGGNSVEIDGLRLTTEWEGVRAALEITDTSTGLTTVTRA